MHKLSIAAQYLNCSVLELEAQNDQILVDVAFAYAAAMKKAEIIAIKLERERNK